VHFQSIKESGGSFRDLQYAHALKQEKKIIKGAMAQLEGMKEHFSRPSGCTHAIKGNEGALAHAKGTKENHSCLCGAIMCSREGAFLCDQELCSRGKLDFFGCSFQS